MPEESTKQKTKTRKAGKGPEMLLRVWGYATKGLCNQASLEQAAGLIAAQSGSPEVCSCKSSRFFGLKSQLSLLYTTKQFSMAMFKKAFSETLNPT